MANVKNRVSSSKTVSKRVKGSGKIGKHKQSLSGFNNVETHSDMKTNTSQSKGKLKIKPLVKDKVKETVLVTDAKLKRKIHIGKDRFLNDEGHIKIKTKETLRICNDILKNELLICDKKKKSLKSTTQKGVANNNNNIVISEQNCNGGNVLNLSSTERNCDGEKVLNISPKGINCNSEKVLNTCPKDKKQNSTRTYTSTGILIRKYPINKRKPKKGLFQCDYCQKQFDTKSSLRRHVYLHLDIKKFTCHKCNKVFRKQLYLSAHITRQHPNWDQHYMCNLCDKPFLLRENLIVHMASHTNTETMFKCIYCKEKFTTQIDLVQHEKTHLISDLYDCIICEQSFDCRNKLTMHFKTHLRVKDFICQHCGKEFLRMNSMRRHVQICHAGIRIQCAICKKYLKGHLSEHMRTHEKRRPHKCPDCGQSFTQSTQLTVHRRSHTGARPYPCRICNRPFTHSNALMLHIRRHTGEKPFECAMCPMSFSQLPHMKAHMRKIHGKENPYRCKKCKQFFKLKVHLDSHTRVCRVGEKELSFEEKIEASVKVEDEEAVQSPMSLSRMRFLLALLLTMIASKEKLQYLGA